jgi:hypothetical protein
MVEWQLAGENPERSKKSLSQRRFVNHESDTEHLRLNLDLHGQKPATNRLKPCRPMLLLCVKWNIPLKLNAWSLVPVTNRMHTVTSAYEHSSPRKLRFNPRALHSWWTRWNWARFVCDHVGFSPANYHSMNFPSVSINRDCNIMGLGLTPTPTTKSRLCAYTPHSRTDNILDHDKKKFCFPNFDILLTL